MESRGTSSAPMRTILSIMVVALVGCTVAQSPESMRSEEALASPSRLLSDPSVCPDGYVQNKPRPGANGNYVVAGQTRSFELRLPPPSFTGPRPVFLAFHGTSESGRSFVNRARLSDWTARG